MLWSMVYESWQCKEPSSRSLTELQIMFRSELQQLKEGPKARLFDKNPSAYIEAEAKLLDDLCQDKEGFITRCWLHYRKSKHRAIVLFIDNVDRASESAQKEVYAFAHKLADRTGCTVIITMRESTYYRGKASDFLDVRSSDLVFHLQTPELVQLISKRIKYIENCLDQDYRLSEWTKSPDWSDFEKKARRYAEHLKQTFLQGDGGVELISLLAALSWHSVRSFLAHLQSIHRALDAESIISWTFIDVLAPLLVQGEQKPTQVISPYVFRPVAKRNKCNFLKLRIMLFLQYGVKPAERRQGVSSIRLCEFCRVYGYQTAWIERSIEELVRERLLECLELPSDEEFTKSFTFNSQHTLRPSPLAVMVIERLFREPLFWIVNLWDTPFHDSAALSAFVKAARATLGESDAGIVDIESLKRLATSDVASLAATYMLACYDNEKLPSARSSHDTELSTTEDRLARIIEEVKSKITRKFPVLAERRIRNERPQLQIELFSPLTTNSPDTSKETFARLVQVPKNLQDAKINTSHSLALVLWALVNARVSGVKSANGVLLTRIINQCLLDDHHKVEPTNISRVLRGPTALGQTWLLRAVDASGHPEFSLARNWHEAWKTTFHENPPLIEI